VPDQIPTLAEFEAWTKIWPVTDQHKMQAPVRVGMDRRTGRVIVGWDHVLQSLEMLFATRYHERVLRQWVGSFVPHLLGKNITEPTVTRFWWAIISAIDLWEPNYAIKRIFLRTGLADPTTADGIRTGGISFLQQGIYMPRGFLGDKTPETMRSSAITGRGNSEFSVSSP
jgi:phage baseplate assembly protein W